MLTGIKFMAGKDLVDNNVAWPSPQKQVILPTTYTENMIMQCLEH